MPNQRINFSQGLVTSRDPSTLREGELSTAVGCEYRVGSPHLYKQMGRSAEGTTLGSQVDALAKLNYSDFGGVYTTPGRIVAHAGGTLYEATVVESAIPAALSFSSSGLTGLTSGTRPSFAASANRWIMVDGSNDNYLREPADVPGGSNGAWRMLGMTKPAGVLKLETVTGAQTSQKPGSDTGDFVSSDGTADGTRAYDAVGDTPDWEGTYAYSELRTVTSETHTWTWDTNLAETDEPRELTVVHEGVSSAETVNEQSIALNAASWRWSNLLKGSKTDVIRGSIKIEVSNDYSATTPTWETISDLTIPYAKKESKVQVPTATDLSTDFAVKVTHTVSTALGTREATTARVYDISVVNVQDTAATTTFSTDTGLNGIVYAYTERYTDSDGVIHESPLSAVSERITFADIAAVRVTFPGVATNTRADRYVVYRSLDEAGGGYPYMWEVAEVPLTTQRQATLTWLDDFDLSLTDVADKLNLIPQATVLYPDGSNLTFELNGTPPKAKFVTEFQNSMCYVPVGVNNRLFYSIPSSLTAAAMEQVPAPYYLQFDSAENDEVVSLARVNSGRALLVFFSRYTMLVTQLPQFFDAGLFDTRVTERLSNTRGTAGPLCTAEFSLPTGRTMAASVDGLGLWVTDGVSVVQEWSRDLNWEDTLGKIDHSTSRLYDNPEMRRLEFVYKSGSNWLCYYFFYGRMKQDGDGQGAPLITGPHPTKCPARLYTTIGTNWIGYQGDTSGQIYRERTKPQDEANAYDSNGSIPFQAKTGDYYVGGLGRASLLVFGYPKFGSANPKDVTLVGTFRRDGSTQTVTKEKSYRSNEDKKVYWHRYADRHSIEVKDISTSSLAALVGYEVEIRDAGVGRDE